MEDEEMAVLDSFADFTRAHPLYGKAYAELSALNCKAALAAAVVHAVYPVELALVAEPLLGYLRQRYGRDLVPMYASRLLVLEKLQLRFDSSPGTDTIGDSSVRVDRDNYNVALLMSIVLSNHRFEIMQWLKLFLKGLQSRGRVAILGTGTGYELKLVAEILSEWSIESYDIDPSSEREARDLLGYFDIGHSVQYGRELLLGRPDPGLRQRYHAIVACEVLEHLRDPARALQSLREYLVPAGRMFVTMAINIAQEDHVFWYPDLRFCREQLHACGWKICSEWIAPQCTLPPPAHREGRFKRGNYVAEVARR
jgi:SAM-dependent methyltransferase